MFPMISCFFDSSISPSTVADTVTAEMLQGVLSEVIGLLPVCLPVMITFIGIRKGIAFVKSMLQSA